MLITSGRDKSCGPVCVTDRERSCAEQSGQMLVGSVVAICHPRISVKKQVAWQEKGDEGKEKGVDGNLTGVFNVRR